MALMKPKEITLTSNVNNEKVSVTFNIGRYNGYDGTKIIGHGIELLDAAARKKMLSTDGVFATKLQAMLKIQGHYVELVTDEGTALLDTVKMLQVALPDPDIALKLMREVHDYNTALFNSANLLSKSQSMMKKVQELGMEMLNRLSPSSSAKKPRQSKS